MVNKFILRVLKLGGLAIASTTCIIPAGFASADTSSVDYIFLVDSNQQSCQQIGEAYQEVKAFETANFYVNICQKDRNYYYLGEAKTGTIDTIFLPANALATGEMYRANNGNVAYIVTILPNETILSIERNGAQVLAESSLNKQCINPDDILQIQGGIASQIYYPLSDVRILPERGYIEVNSLETVDISSFSNFNSLAEYNPEAILNLQVCNLE